MTVFDYAVLAVVGLSVLVSVIRGAVREVLALAGWVAAFLIANLMAPHLALMLPVEIPGEALKLLIAFLTLFIGTLLVAGLATIAVAELIKAAGLTTLDRGLGALFGAARGGLIVLVAVLLAGLTAMPKERFWQEAALSGPLEAVAMDVKQWLPYSFAQRIRYD
ncbi:MAG TPA: CvpA family protein [Pelomicrobium sp.]|nr:CvpA family protein [Pelomicrobium sp.]